MVRLTKSGEDELKKLRQTVTDKVDYITYNTPRISSILPSIEKNEEGKWQQVNNTVQQDPIFTSPEPFSSSQRAPSTLDWILSDGGYSSSLANIDDLPTTPAANNGKWWAGDIPLYADYVARLYNIKDTLTPEQFNTLSTQIDALKLDPTSGFYRNNYTGITSPYVAQIAKLGIDVSGGINDEWIAKNQYLLQGARYTDAGSTPATPGKKASLAEQRAYAFYQIYNDWQDTKEVLAEQDALKKEIAYWVGRDDLNLSDDQILDRLDWNKKYKYLKGLKDAQTNGRLYDYTSPIDYNPDNLRGYIWAARNGGGSGNDEMDAINAALGRGNTWKENKEISEKLDFKSDNFNPYQVKSTLDDAAQYFGVKSFEPGWAEKVAKDIDWNNPEEVKNWTQVYNAEQFTAQAEAEAKTIYDRVDYLIANGHTDPAEIEDRLWDSWDDKKDPALTALKELDSSLVRPDKLKNTTRPINYSKKELEAYIADQCAKANSKASLTDFGDQVENQLNGTAGTQPTAASTPTSTPAQKTPEENLADLNAQRNEVVSEINRIAISRDASQRVHLDGLQAQLTVIDQQIAQQQNALAAPDARMVEFNGPSGTPAPVAPTSTPAPTPTPGPSATPAPDARMVGFNGTAPTEAPAATETTAQYNDLIAKRDQLMQERENIQAQLNGNELPMQWQKITAQKKIDDLTKDLQSVQAEIDQISPASSPAPVTNQAERAVNDARTESIRKAARIIWAMGTNDEKLVFSMAPVANAENIAADMSSSVQNGVATASSLYSTSQKQANDFTVSHYTGAKQAVAHYDEMQNALTELQQRRGQLVTEINGIAMSRDAEQRAHLDGLQAQLTVLDQNIAQQQKAISDFQMRYNQAQGDLKTMNSMYDAAAANLAMSQNPGLDLSTPQGQQALTEAKAKVRSLQNSVDLIMEVGSQYTPTQWAPNTVFQAWEENGYTTQEVSKAAASIIADSDQKLAALNQAVEQMEASGMAIPGDWQGNVDRERARLTKQKQEAEDYLLKTRDDFDNVVFAGKTSVQDDMKNGGNKYNSLTRDIVSRLNGSKDIPDEYFTSEGRKQQYDNVANMTRSELRTYIYKEEQEGEAAAYEYYQSIRDNILVRNTIEQTKELEQFAQDMPVLAAITSIGISPDTIKSAGYVAASLLSGQEINPYNRFFDSTWATGTLDQNAKETLLKPLQEDSFAKAIAGLGYDAVTSGAKSLLNSALTGPLAGGSAILSALPMGIQAAGAAAQQTKLQGGSDTQAALIAGVTLAAETLSETITTQNIAQAIDSGAKGVKGAMKKVLSNDMVEEFLGESVNQLVESVADDVVMGELSQRNQRIKEYEKTMSHDEAVRQADKDFWKDILAAGVTGALSSAGTSGISYVAGRLTATPSATVGTPEGQLRANMLANNGLPTDHTVNDRTARTVSMLTASLNANRASQVQAVSAALFPVSNEAASQRAALSAGMRLSNQLGTEQAVTLMQDVILAAAQDGMDMDTVKNAMTIAALGQGEASQVLNEMAETGLTGGDLEALINAATRDTLRPAVVDRMQAIIHNDRVTLRERALIGDGALAGVRPYEQAYSKAQAQEEQTQANLEAEQERAETAAQNLVTVQAQYAEDPGDQSKAAAFDRATSDMTGQLKVVEEYQQSLDKHQQETREAEENLTRVQQEEMKKVREQAMADVAAEEQAEAQAAAETQAAAEAAALAEAEAQAQEGSTDYDNLVAQRDQLIQQRDAYQAQLDNNEFPQQWQQSATKNKIANLNKTIQELDAQIAEVQPSTPANDTNTGAPLDTTDQMPYTGINEVNGNGVQSGSGDQAEGLNAGQLAGTSGRDDGRGNNLYVGPGTGREGYSRGAEGTTQPVRQNEGRVPARLLSEAGRTNLTQRGVTDMHLQEESNQQRFSDALTAAKESNTHGAYVDAQSVEELTEKGAKMIVSEDGLAGAAVATTGKEKGNIFGVFKDRASKAKKASTELIIQAIAQGGNKLDCYDGGLRGMYQKMGMIPVARVAFNEDFMPDGWNVERDDHPDIVFWMHNGDSADTVAEKYGLTEDEGGYHKYTDQEIADLPLFGDVTDANGNTEYGYDRAWAYRDQLLEEAQKQRGSGDSGLVVSDNPVSTSGDVDSSLSDGVPPTGNNLSIPDSVPNTGSKQRQFGSQTAQRSNALHNEVKDYLREHSGYDPETNREQIDRSIDWVQQHATENDDDGYHGAVAEAQSPDFNPFSADGQARMLTLMSMAALKGDIATETALADAYNQQGTVLGRALQARQIFNMMTPLGRQAVLQKEVNRINQGYVAKGKTTRVELSPDTLEAAGKAKTAEDFQRVQKQAYKELAEQMPPTWKDKLQAWRMLSMLGNLRTHVRNMLGNAIFMPAVKLKNVIGTALEGMAVKPGSGEMRTKSLTVSKENRDFAKADALKMRDTLTGEAKYNADQKVYQERKIFGTKDTFLSRTVGKALQWLSDKNSEVLEKEDWVFLRKHYENALGGWMQANKLTPETITPEQLTQAREYAINEAQKATYRDANKIASLFADISRKGGLPGFVVDTALPFKKTPANILKRGIEYSPIGLLRTLAADTKKVKQYTDWVKNGSKGALPKNAISPTQYIDRLSSGLSGSAIAAVGALMASLGLVTVGYDEDKKTLEELEGKQEYALNIKIGDTDISYTIDWAAPFTMPFFVGASIYNIMQDGIHDPGQIADALLEITEPVFNLSMLEGVNSLMETSQWSGGNAFTQVGEKLATNYLSSFIPTFVGQVSRTIDPARRKSYVESGAAMSQWRYALEQAQNKTPFSVYNIPYRNVWGEEDRSPEWLATFENFISPGYISEIKPGKLEKELASLYDETGEKKAVPQAASKSPYVNGQQVKLNAEQYDQYTVARGTAAKKLLEELIERPEWQALDGAAKIDIVSDAWTYANGVAVKELFPDAKTSSWIQSAQKAGNAADAIMERHEEKAQKDYIDGYKTALFKAVDENDREAFQTSAYALMEADQRDRQANGKKPNPAYVSNLLSNHYKSIYIEALQNNDTEKAESIKENLLNFPGSGIDARTFFAWEKEATKKNDVRQNRLNP